MRVPRLALLFACSLALLKISGAVVVEEHEDGTFWRQLGPDEAMPPGAHVRLNITSLIKTIRVDMHGVTLLEGQDRTGTALAVTEPAAAEAVVAAEETVLTPRETIRASLLKLPDTELARYHISSKELQMEGAWEHKVEGIWARRQEDLHEAMRAVADHIEIFNQRIDVLANPTSGVAEILEALRSLESDLGDIDMARDFHSIGGWAPLVALLAEDQPEPVRVAAAAVIGDAVRNMPEFQTWLSQDTIGTLATVGDTGVAPQEVTGLHLLVEMYSSPRSTILERKKALFALASALYNHPANLELFLRFGGADALLRSLQGAAENEAMALRAIRVVSDLGFEAAESGEVVLAEHLQIMLGEAWCDTLAAEVAAWTAGKGQRTERFHEAVATLLAQTGRTVSLRSLCGDERVDALRMGMEKIGQGQYSAEDDIQPAIAGAVRVLAR